MNQEKIPTVIGFDVSTTCIGVSILHPSNPYPEIVLMDHIDFNGCDDKKGTIDVTWQKVDRVREFLQKICVDIDAIFIEDPVKSFQQGMSSAQVIVKLARFNGIVSLIARDHFQKEPIYISSGEARKLCGLKMQQRKKCGLSHKEQVFNLLNERDLKHIEWPMKKQTKKAIEEGKKPEPAGFCYDRADAYVIAKAGLSLLS